MTKNKNKLRDLFAEARAIYYALLNGAVSKEKGIQKIEIILAEINKEASHIAKKHGVKHKDLTYKDLGGIL
jgi:hypothetical protein